MRVTSGRWRAAVLGLALAAPAAATVVRPTDPSRLEPAVARLVDEVAGAVAADPARSSGHARLGMVYEANNLWAEARDSYRRAIELEPGRKVWRLHLAVATREAGDAVLALALLKRVAADAPGLAAARQRLGEALLEIGDVEGAKREFEQLMNLEPRAPQGPAGLANALLRERRYSEAATLLERAVDLAPSYRVARYLLGLAYRGLGRLADAERELAAGAGGEVRFLPDPLTAEIATYAVNLTSRLATASGHLAAGRVPAAVGILEQTLEAHPRNVTVLNNLAIAYLRMGRLEDAHELLIAAREIDESRFSTWLNLVSYAQRAGRLDEALGFADGAVERAPDMARTHLARANVLGSRGDFEEALVSLENAARLEPGDPRTRLMIGDVCLRLERPGAAAEAFRSATELAPDAFPAQLGLAASLLKLGELDAAETALARARELAPGHPRLIELERRLAVRRSS